MDYRFKSIYNRLTALEGQSPADSTSGIYAVVLDTTSWTAITDVEFGDVYRATVTHSFDKIAVNCTCWENGDKIHPLRIREINNNSLYIYMPTALTLEVAVG